MKTQLPLNTLKRHAVCSLLALCALAATSLAAQTPAARIQGELSSSSMALVPGSKHPMAQAQYDAGRMPSSTRLNGMTIVFNRSADQEAALKSLMAAQQDPNSPLFHQWLTPDQFAARFGVAESDLQQVQSWLEQQGFSIDSVARSKNSIHFSGTVGQVEQAFQTQMHYYTVDGVKHFAPSTALSVPAAISSMVTTIRNLDDFRPRPMVIPNRTQRPTPAFTSSVTGSVFLAPGDIKVAYDLNPLINAGTNGAGQSIAIMGQSQVSTTDIANFQSAAGLPSSTPIQVLVPNTGSPTVSTGDESESDLDLEWSGGIAPGAQIYFVYVGGDTNYSAFDSVTYAVDEKIGNIISISYGQCEPLLPTGFATSFDAVLEQAGTQGQTVVAAAGDDGSTSCYQSPTTTNPTLAQQESVAVSYPASSAYATGVGGTEITEANDAVGQYWAAATSTTTDNITSLLKYIPEVAWNDDTAAVAAGNTTLSATGGGVSTLYTAQPSWQTTYFNTTGEANPNNKARLVPDISFYASPDLPGYLYCTSDQSAWSQGQAASCNSGFRDSSTQDLTLAGGTSFATPIFAGMVAILNQDKGYTTGQGFINPTLYTLASNSSTYSSAFHDITTGNNECPSGLGATYCSSAGEGSYTTGTGYDLVTGLGSIDVANLAGASGWPAATGPSIGTSTTLSAATTTPTVSTNDIITITVASDSGTSTPTGNLTISVDGAGSSYGTTGATTTTVALTSNGTATYTANFSAAGTHTIIAQYAGDTTHAASTGAIAITIGGTSSGKGTISLGATAVTVARGSSASSTITVTPGSGYTGTVYLSFDTSNDNALANLCYQFSDTLSNGEGSVTVTGTTPATTQLTLDTNAADCATGAARSGGHAMHRFGSIKAARNNAPAGPGSAPLTVAFAGLLLAGFLGRHSRKLRSLVAVVGLLGIGLALSACGGGGGVSSTTSNPPKGTYTITVTGQDSTTATITSTTTFSFTIN